MVDENAVVRLAAFVGNDEDDCASDGDGGEPGEIDQSGPIDVDGLVRFFLEYTDHLAPRLDPYEQAVYLYAYRHSRLLGKKEILIQMTTARARMARNPKGTAISQKTVRDKLRTLRLKGCLDFVTVPLSGTRIRVKLPSEVSGVAVDEPAEAVPKLETLDFYSAPENRLRILLREERRCFYCLCDLSEGDFAIEHVFAFATRDNSYRNVVAACHPCNHRKGRGAPDDLLRALYREGLLNTTEFQHRIAQLSRLRSGLLRPPEG